MQEKVEKFIDKWNMISAEDTVIVGVSGGADSVALLLVLDELRRKRGYLLRAVHINHGIRGTEAKEDEDYVRRLCEKRHIPLECVHADVLTYAKGNKLSEEEAGRLIRREAFERNLKVYGGTKIALAHHQEDNAETFFLNLARGSKLKGLGGIYPVNGNYIRPFLCVERKEIEEYLNKKNVSYCMDKTNMEDTYMRNRIRHHVIPYFRENINAQTVAHMNDTMEYLREVQAFLECEEENAYRNCVSQGDQGYLIEQESFCKLPELLKNMLVKKVIVCAAQKEKDIGKVHVQKVTALMGQQTGRKLNLPYNLVARRTYEGVVLSKESKSENAKVLEISLKDGMTWAYGGMQFVCKVFPKPEGEWRVPKKTFTKWFDYDIIKQNVSVRTRQPGDRIVIDREGHAKKLKSFYVDEKISSELRESIPVLAVEHEILWIVGYRQSKKYQVTKETKTILEIVVDGGE